MKIGHYTDIHYMGKAPKRRKDKEEILDTIVRKHEYIYEKCEEEDTAVILFSGDMNDGSMPAASVVGSTMKAMRKRHCKEYACIGNHDVIGNNSEKVEQVMAGLLFSSGLLGRLNKTEPVWIDDGDIRVAVFGVDIHKDMDNLEANDYYVERPEGADYVILVAHGWLVDNEIKLEGVKTTTFDAAAASGTQADLVVWGHYHPGHKEVRKKRTDGGTIIFYNPGAPLRIKAAESEMKRQVGFGIIELSRQARDFDGEECIHTWIKFHEFPKHIALPAEEVLDREQLLEDIKRQEEKEGIEQKYADFVIKSFSPRNVIIEIANEDKISTAAKDDLIERIDKAEQESLQKELDYSTQ